MIEYTRDIKPVDYTAPQFSAPTNSLGADVANALNTGVQIFGMMQNKERDKNLDVMLSTLGAFEMDLSKNDISRSERLLRLDKKVRELAPDPESQNYLRKRLAQKRGGFIQQQFVQEKENQELQRQQMVEQDFQTAIANAPQLLSGYKRNPDGTVNEADKLSVINEFEDYRIREYQRAKETEVYQQQLAQGGEAALQGAARASQVIGSRIRDVFAPTSSGFVQTISNLDLSDPENIKTAEGVLRNARNTFRTAKNSIESEFNAIYSGQTDDKVRLLLEKNRDSALSEMDNIIKTLEETDLSKVETLKQQIEIVESGLKLKGLDNFQFVSMLEQIAPQSSRYIVQKLIVDHGEILSYATDEMARGIMSGINAQQATTQFGKEFTSYMESGDTEKASDMVLKTFYGYARDTITNMPARDLTAGEVDKISGGLLGIMQEAAVTDDPKQIKEATRLLNSPNFKQFFDQLPEDRKAPMGRFIGAFNQDVLIDSTDGLFSKIGKSVTAGDADIIYDADRGEFLVQSTRGLQAQPTGSLGLEFAPRPRYSPESSIKRFVNEANQSLKMIRENAQYDPISQDAKVLIDTMIAEKLPRDITVKGKLNVFTPEVREQQTEEQAQTIRSNKEILQDLQGRIDNLSADTLVGSVEFKKILEELNK